jgi:(1->4)-alpha-D-glucan 1-alpha-D-glucosylmutase
VPDFYQGTEFWDLNLVDPDNRRPVDFQLRQRVLHDLEQVLRRLRAGICVCDEVRSLGDTWTDGRVKMFVTARGLQFRREHADLLIDGSYEPLSAEGPGAGHLVAFARRGPSGTLIAVAPRLIMGLDEDVWARTTLALPAAAGSTEYRHVLTGETVHVDDGRLRLSSVFAALPVGLVFRGD